MPSHAQSRLHVSVWVNSHDWGWANSWFLKGQFTEEREGLADYWKLLRWLPSNDRFCDILNISELSGNFSIGDHLFQMGWNMLKPSTRRCVEKTGCVGIPQSRDVRWLQVMSPPKKNREFMAIRLNSPISPGYLDCLNYLAYTKHTCETTIDFPFRILEVGKIAYFT